MAGYQENNTAKTQGARESTTFDDAWDDPTLKANYILRLFALLTAFIASVVMGAAKETKSIVTSSGSTVNHQFKAAGTSQFDYIIAVNAIACIYSLASLMYMRMRGGLKHLLLFNLTMVDLAMVAFLFSGLGSGSAMTVLLRRGGAGGGIIYPRICNVYSKFCNQVSAAIFMSVLPTLSYLVLVYLSYLNIYKRALF